MAGRAGGGGRWGGKPRPFARDRKGGGGGGGGPPSRRHFLLQKERGASIDLLDPSDVEDVNTKRTNAWRRSR